MGYKEAILLLRFSSLESEHRNRALSSRDLNCLLGCQLPELLFNTFTPFATMAPPAQLPLRQLVKNGPKIPAVGFGLMGLSIAYGTTEYVCRPITTTVSILCMYNG